MCKVLCSSLLLLSVLVSSVSAADPLTRLDETFAPGISGWKFQPGSAEQIDVELADDSTGPILKLKPGGKTLGVESRSLQLGTDLAADQQWTCGAHVFNAGLDSGVFAMSIYCDDASGKPLQQMNFASFNTDSPQDQWRRAKAAFGPGTDRPFPAGTAAIRVRFSFYEPSGNCRGEVHVKQVRLEPYAVPGNPAWPKEIVANVGDDLQVRFESKSFWTLYRIDYQGTRLGLDRFGSHYGTVASFPGIGFIGTGHTENADEQVLSLQLKVNDQPVDIPEPEIACDKIELHKSARLKTLLVDSVITVQAGQIREVAELTATEPTPVNLVYHFMHPWLPSAEEFCGETLDGTFLAGKFNGARDMKIDQPTRWSALFDSTSGTGAVTCVIDAPAQPNHWRTRYWDIDGRYRKHYFVTFLNQTIPAETPFRYEILTIPFAAEQATWHSKARQIAADVSRKQ